MSKASHKKDKKPVEFTIDVEAIAKEMKHNFSKFMIKLGAHITHLAIFWAGKAFKKVKKAFAFIKNKVMPKILKVNGIFVRFKNRIFNFFDNIEKYFYQLNDSVCDTKVNKGFFSAAKLFSTSILSKIWSFRHAAVTVFNWTAPVVSIAFLVSIVTYATNLNYGISVECNGEKLGIISEEADYDEAEKALQDRITYVDGNEKVVLEPKLSLKIIDESEEVVNPTQLVDKMIVNSDAELADAYGIYVDGQFLGAVENRQPIMDTLAGILANYQSSDVKSIKFQQAVEYKSGLYLKSSIVDSNSIINVLTSDTQAKAYYTIQEDDTPIKIASKNGITLSQLKALNPGIENDCEIGDQVLLNRSNPYMTVEVVKEIQYTDVLDYETQEVESNTLYKGNSKVLVEGEEGESTVTAEVTYTNGYEVGRTIISSVVTKEPVTEKLAIGTLTPKPSKGAAVSGNGQYCWPVAGGYVSSPFGEMRGGTAHKGVDIAAPAGTSIFAAESGTVIMSQWYYDYGNCIMIRHANGNVTVYGHSSKLLVSVGQTVQRGELIALVGRTGSATGNHLHFEVRVNGSVVNPMKYIG